MARRPGQLTEEDKLKLQSQGLPPDCQDELDIVKSRYKLDKDCTIVDVNTEQSVSHKEVINNMGHLLNTTKNDGGKDISDYGKTDDRLTDDYMFYKLLCILTWYHQSCPVTSHTTLQLDWYTQAQPTLARSSLIPRPIPSFSMLHAPLFSVKH